MRSTTPSSWLITLAIVLAAPSLSAQQGEGTGGDFVLRTGVGLAAPDENDKTICPGEFLTVELASPGGTLVGAPLLLIADVAPVSLNIAGLGGILGVGINLFPVVNGIGTIFGPQIPPGGSTTLTFVLPPSPLWNDGGPFLPGGAPDLGIFLQAIAAVPGGSLGGLFELSNTVKHEVLESPDPGSGFSDDASEALLCPGLDDGDLGQLIGVGTGVFANDVETIGTIGFGTQTGFSLVGPGQGTRQAAPEAVIRFTATGGGSYTFDLCSSDYDTTIYLTDATANPAPIILNEDDVTGICTNVFRSRLGGVCLGPGEQVLVWIDGFDAASFGAAALVVTVAHPLVVSGLSLASGVTAGGEVVTVTGCDLAGVTSVLFDGVPGTISSSGFTCLDVQVPPAAAGPAIVDVVITDGTQTITLPGAWEYLGSPPATLSVASTPALVIDGSMPHQDQIALTTIGSLVDLDVDIDITHPFITDLLIDLTSPEGTILRLHDGSGFGVQNLVGNYPMTILPEGGGPSTGPAEDLTDFAGEAIDGTWTLDLVDAVPAFSTGVLNQWGLNLRYTP